MSKIKFYCPKCGKKQLIESNKWTDGCYWRVWKCLHNQQGRYSYRSSTKEKGPPCDLIIEAEGRHATIDDYGGILGKLSKINIPQIQQWLLENDQDVHKRGMDVLYQGPLVDVVRRRNRHGVGVALYWRARTWDEDSDALDPFDNGEADALRSRAANFVEHGGLPIGGLFARNGMDVWRKDYHDTIFKDRPYGKGLKKDIVAWAASLEAALPGLIATCESEDQRWTQEGTQFSSSIRQLVMRTGQGGFQMHDYCGNTKTALMHTGYVSARAALEIGQALGISFRLAILSVSPHYATPEEAIKIEEVLGRKMTISVSSDLRYRRFTFDEAVEVAKILVANDD